MKANCGRVGRAVPINPLLGQIGFVFSHSHPLHFHRNHFYIQHLPFICPPADWLCFARRLPRLPRRRGPAHLPPAGVNWVCFAQILTTETQRV